MNRATQGDEAIGQNPFRDVLRQHEQVRVGRRQAVES
jgi:hypothetical protein